MTETKTFGSHIDDALLWRWQSRELDDDETARVQQHLQSCASCRRSADAIARLLNTMQAMHRDSQPTLAGQMQLLRELENQFAPAEMPSMLVNTSRRLVRWLAPAVAVLVTLFVLLRQETATPSEAEVTLLPEMPESRLLFATNDEQLQQVMWELAVNENDANR
ncbi:zf-HC2 domain-containing protein [candidate division KSB1 bacterium]|nr:zf-HC2 domain-containing protein [candidate division KSB1 bacterium]